MGVDHEKIEYWRLRRRQQFKNVTEVLFKTNAESLDHGRCLAPKIWFLWQVKVFHCGDISLLHFMVELAEVRVSLLKLPTQAIHKAHFQSKDTMHFLVNLHLFHTLWRYRDESNDDS